MPALKAQVEDVGLHACVLVCGLALASTAIGADPIEQINLPPTQAPEHPPADHPQPFALPPVEPEPDTGTMVDVHGVVFRDNTVIPIAELNEIAQPYIKKGRVSVAELEALRQELTRHYIDRGYVTSGVISGSVTDGVLTFQIVEGRLKAVNVSGQDGLDKEYVTSRLQRSSDTALNIDVLRERFQLLLDDPLFASMNAALLPDPEAGQAILDVGVQRERPYQLTAFVNNYRPPSIGAWSVGLLGWVRNLTGRGDLLDASLQDSPQDGSPFSGGIGWRVPLNWSGTALGLRYYYDGSAVINEALQGLDIESVTQSWEATLSQNLIDRLRHQLGVSLTLLGRRNETTLLDQPFSFVTGVPSGITNAQAWRLAPEYTYRSEHEVLGLRLTYSKVRNNVEQLPRIPPEVLPARDYDIWLLQATFTRRVGQRGAQIVLRGTTQWTAYRLLAIDDIAIGGVYTVRGYPQNTLVRDTGVILNAEFEYPVWARGSSARLALVPFCDYGYGKNTGASGDVLSSCGLAVRGYWQGLRVDFAAAARINYPAFVANEPNNLQGYGVYLQISYDFVPRRRP